jgi:hypothetical protein
MNRLNRNTPYLKVHMLDGEVYVLSSWSTQEKDKTVSGQGNLLDVNRKKIRTGDFVIPMDTVVLFETNDIRPSPAILPMTVLTVPSLIVSGICLSNPKACFGSCPTFYAWDGEKMLLQAEGFSSSVTRALEAEDIDALCRARPLSPHFEIVLTNEAMETHVIRSVNLLGVPRPKDGRTFFSLSGRFRQAPDVQEPTTCRGPEGDCLAKIKSYDGIERFSRADSRDLATRETVELTFDPSPNGQLGLVISFRQTLMTTYLFYQGLAYMGHEVGYWLSRLEQSDPKMRSYSRSVGELLGGIEVWARNDQGKWIKAGEIKETGPIASDTRLVELPEKISRPLHVRLNMTKGLWRLDWIALARLSQRVDPVRISPSLVLNGGKVDEEARRRLLDPSETLVTMPGDSYTLAFELPTDYPDYELFLESRGYYLEWIRESWLAEESLARTIMMYKNPSRFLKVVAPEFKKAEPQLEDSFWRSKYAPLKNN